MAWVMLALACGQAPAPETIDAPARPEDARGPVLENMTARIYLEETLEQKVEATRAILDLRRMEMILDLVKVSFYEDGQWKGDLSSDRGIVYLRADPEAGIAKNDFVLRGNVRYNDPQGASVTAPQVRYSNQTERLKSGGGQFQAVLPRGEQGTFRISGESFEVDRALTDFTFQNPTIEGLQGEVPAGDANRDRGNNDES